MFEWIFIKVVLDGGIKCIDVVIYIFVFWVKILNVIKGNKVLISVKDY